MVACLAVHLTGYALMLTALYARAATPVFIACALVLGASTPPMGPLVRSRWPAVVSGDRLRAAYALDAVITEATYLLGPLFVSLMVLVASPVIALAAAGSCMLAGVTIVLILPAPPPDPETKLAPAPRRFGVFGYRSANFVLAMVGFHIFERVRDNPDMPPHALEVLELVPFRMDWGDRIGYTSLAGLPRWPGSMAAMAATSSACAAGA